MKVIIYTVSLFFLCSCASNKINSQNKKEEIQVVLLAGQSNMVGAGNYDELDKTIKKRIEKNSDRVSLVFNGKKVSPLTWYKNNPTEKYNFTKRFGPELLFGLTLAEKYPDKEFVLIKRSQGGTALYGAWNPNWSSDKAKAVEKPKKQSLQLYAQHLEDIKISLVSIQKENKTFKILGLLWMQGENDAAIEISATTYKENLKNLIDSYRTEFIESKMPFVVGQINSNYGKFKNKGSKMVRTFMEEIANEDKNVAIIKTSMDKSWLDYPKHSDNIHYNSEGQKRLGIAFANKLIELIN